MMKKKEGHRGSKLKHRQKVVVVALVAVVADAAIPVQVVPEDPAAVVKDAVQQVADLAEARVVEEDKHYLPFIVIRAAENDFLNY